MFLAGVGGKGPMASMCMNWNGYEGVSCEVMGRTLVTFIFLVFRHMWQDAVNFWTSAAMLFQYTFGSMVDSILCVPACPAIGMSWKIFNTANFSSLGITG